MAGTKRTYWFDPEKFEIDYLPLTEAVGGALKPSDPKKLAWFLSKWMRDMKAWGEDVRLDIIRLEGAVHAAPGDPGPPPPAPRGK